MSDDREALFAAIAPREERVTVGGIELVVRELTTASDVAGLASSDDADYRVLVRSVFRADGSLFFTDEDVPRIKASALTKVLPLLRAARRVNGLDGDADIKKSEPQPLASSTS